MSEAWERQAQAQITAWAVVQLCDHGCTFAIRPYEHPHEVVPWRFTWTLRLEGDGTREEYTHYSALNFMDLVVRLCRVRSGR